MLLLYACIILNLVNVSLSRPLETRDRRQRAVYVLGNDHNGAFIASSLINEENGTLGKPVKTYTGGKGLFGNTATGQSGPDSLFGQNAVAISGDYLFTVNPGSNQLSMFVIDQENPTYPRLVSVASTLGEFPMSVAFSPQLNQACVLNGGKVGGVTCYAVGRKEGLIVLDKKPRSLGPNFDQTTPPVGPPLTASDIFFNPEGTGLFAVIKGNAGVTPKISSSFLAWPVKRDTISSTAIISQLADLPMSFGGTFVDNSHFANTDASFGVSLMAVSDTFKITEVAHTVVPGQKALCWGASAPQFNVFYGLDAGQPTISIFNLDATLKAQFAFPAQYKGAFDSAVDRDYLYTLSAVGSVLTFDLKGGNHGQLPEFKQSVDLSVLSGGTTNIFQGLAVFPS